LTHSDLISQCFSNFSSYHALWSHQRDNAGECGALVFLPGKELDWEWWSLVEIRDYLREGGLDDNEVLEGLSDADVGEDFLVLVIEYVDGPAQQKAHFHRISKAKLN